VHSDEAFGLFPPAAHELNGETAASKFSGPDASFVSPPPSSPGASAQSALQFPLFAARDIYAGDELYFPYGHDYWHSHELMQRAASERPFAAEADRIARAIWPRTKDVVFV